MTKNGNIFVVGLLVLFFAAAGNALAASGQSSLNGTTWSGDITSITGAGVATSPPNAFIINSKAGSAELERGVEIARGAPKTCEPYPSPCNPCQQVGPDKG
ncbi:MAG: hypothetical protein ACLP3B_10210 [Syntrophobacteraceae bacterium]